MSEFQGKALGHWSEDHSDRDKYSAQEVSLSARLLLLALWRSLGGVSDAIACALCMCNNQSLIDMVTVIFLLLESLSLLWVDYLH
jgi:hypothetical protein